MLTRSSQVQVGVRNMPPTLRTASASLEVTSFLSERTTHCRHSASAVSSGPVCDPPHSSCMCMEGRRVGVPCASFEQEYT